MEITKEEFMDYETVRQSGATNMFVVNVVVRLSNGLDREKCLYIMGHYTELCDKYGNKTD